MTKEELVSAAISAQANAYSPYSHYRVGAALETVNHKVYTGCNVENASYGATICAERTALFKAVSDGERDFLQLAVVGGPEGELKSFAWPCGICRQALSEFCGKTFLIHLYDGSCYKTCTLEELLPECFSTASME